MWIETINQVRSISPFFSRILNSLLEIPSLRSATFWGDFVPIEIQNEISTIVFVDFNENINFLKKLPEMYRQEECFFVLVATKKNYEMIESATSPSDSYPQNHTVICDMDLLNLRKLGKLTVICADNLNKKRGVSVALIIEMLRLLSWGKEMYVMSRRKEIKTAIYLFKELFGIEIQANHDPRLKHEPTGTTNNFICHQTSEYFKNTRIPERCMFLDMDNIKLCQNEMNRILMELNNLIINCQNPPQSSRRPPPAYRTSVQLSNSVQADLTSNCIDVEVPIVDDLADIFIIWMMTILHSLLPVNVPFEIRSKDKIFLAVKKYLSKDNSRQILLPDIE